MLLNNGIYWDDWTIYDMNLKGLINQFNGNGLIYMAYIHHFLNNLTTNPVLLYHAITLILEVLGIFVFYNILGFFHISENIRTWLTLIFALCPLYTAKIYMITLPYTIGFFLLLYASYSFLLYSYNDKIELRLLSLTLFFISYLFLISSIIISLTFFYLFIISKLRRIEISKNYLKIIFKNTIHYLDFIALPFIFWIIRLIFFKPTGTYAKLNYNEINFDKILNFPTGILLVIKKNIIDILPEVYRAINSPFYNIIFYLFLFILIYAIYRKINISNIPNNKILFIGISLLISAAIPYILVGKIPSFEGYDSRHQVLLKLSIPFIILSIIDLVFSVGFKKIALILLVSSFIVYNIQNQLQHQKSWFKQTALGLLIHEKSQLQGSVNILIEDDASKYNENSEIVRFYCYTGIFKKAFGNEKHFVIQEAELRNLKNNYNLSSFIRDNYNMKECNNLSHFKYILSIEEGSKKLNLTQNIRLLFQYYFDKKEFNKSVSQIIKIKLIPCDKNL